jgi:hypothetical protein
MVMLPKGILALWDNIYDCMFTASEFPIIPDGKFSSVLILY